ncbi:MAG: heparinase II/III family protein [Armatimonadetes bacterium]|nr:heparinase II/III family protein [Armatimonadota bacterium]
MPASRALPILALFALPACAAAQEHPVPREHPRLLGSRAELQQLARLRPQAWQRTQAVARQPGAGDHERIVSIGLVCAIDGDRTLGRAAVDIALKSINGPIRVGHETFAHDLANCALAYDLCYDCWTDAERAAYIDYLNRTVDANVNSETHVFHNGWYGYKNWGIGVGCYATWYENPRAESILATTLADYRDRAAPALELAGRGGGWAEGYYIHYFLYEWLFFCEVARRVQGLDLCADAPDFYRHRAIAGMFEMYPGIRDYGSRRAIPMGDSGGFVFGGDRDKELFSRCILASHYRDDPVHQAVNSFNLTTPRAGVGNYAYMDLLWRDETVPKGDLGGFKLSHLSPGPGYVYARSSWAEDATYFFFKCGDRFTAHQHLDVGHFLIARHEELAGDGGWYYDFASPHMVNYGLRSIAHNTILVLDPAEKWPGIRAGNVTGNDGGQHHNWTHHNGAVVDVADWQKGRAAYDIADLLAYEDHGDWLYVAGDATRAYSPAKLAQFRRQIVYVRPGTFVIFDRVVSKNPAFRKTWLLQAAKPPTGAAPELVVTNGKGRLFIHTLLPEAPEVTLHQGADLYIYGGQSYAPPRNPPGPLPECRIEVSPSQPAAEDWFLHVLTATDATMDSAPPAAVRRVGDTFELTVGDTHLGFRADATGGWLEQGVQRSELRQAAEPL